MSIDDTVSRDLATTAAANRGNLRPLGETLRAVGARAPIPAVRTDQTQLRWLVLGEIYASRVARTAAGIAALASLLVVVAFNVARAKHLLDYDSALFGGPPAEIAVLLLVFIFLVRIAARGWAGAAFFRAASTSADVERMFAASDRPALLFGIAGPFVFGFAFGVAYFVLRGHTVDLFACAMDRSCWGDDVGTYMYASRLRDLGVLAPVGILLALVIAKRPPANPIARLPALKASVVLLAGTFLLGRLFDDGPWSSLLGQVDYNPSPVLRQILMITGSLGVFGMFASIALWRRHTENERIATTSG